MLAPICEEDRATLPMAQRPVEDWAHDVAQLRDYEAWFRALADWYDWHDAQNDCRPTRRL
jgi:hypothetical protein